MLSVSNLAKSYGLQTLFSGVTFNVGSRDRIAVIGPNGSGKTTLFEIIVGNVGADAGSVSMRKDITIGYAKQEIMPDSQELLLDHVAHSSLSASSFLSIAALIFFITFSLLDIEQKHPDPIVEPAG